MIDLVILMIDLTLDLFLIGAWLFRVVLITFRNKFV